MKTFRPFLNKIQNPQHREELEAVLRRIRQSFPSLEPKIAWNQPIFTHHGTFIIGFSAAKRHFAAAPEQAAIERFSNEIKESGYSHTRQLIRIPWGQPVNFELLEKIIRFNMMDKADCPTFWRK